MNDSIVLMLNDNNKDPITVSVSMLVYNHGRFLRKALDSILMQRVNFRYEVVIAEDASQDNSREILLEYYHRYPNIFKLILHEKNVGIVKNVKSKLPFLIGEFIAPLEGDDYWTDPLKLQKQVDILRENPEYSAVAHQVTVIDENDEIVSNKTISNLYCTEKEFTLNHLLQYLMPGQNASMLFRNYLLRFNDKQMETYINSTLMGDRKNAITNLIYGKIWCMKDNMSCYRRHQNSWTGIDRPGGTSCYQYYECFEMEKFAKDMFDITLDFSSVRMRFWFGTVVYFLKNSTKENWNAVKNVFNHNNDRCYKLCFLVIHFFSYPFRKIIHRR